MEQPYQQCTRCVMDTTASDIHFDTFGICNYCSEFLNRSKNILYGNESEKARALATLVSVVKAAGRSKRYDCVVGVSGGVDSSWVLVKAVELGLRPLAVHMDNGWNSELAQSNIANLVQGLGVDLFTHVIDWEEYRKLMQAFFDADVIDVELLYDNAMLAVNYRLAARYGVKYILAGTNQVTEGMKMPLSWNWFKYDKRNIANIGKKLADVRLRTFPAIGTLGYIWHEKVLGIQWTSILDLLPYNKNTVLTQLQNNFRYKPYPYKHYESVFTRFYQGYILPRKFHVDKRKLHLSTLIVSGQLERDEAISILSGLPYPSVKDAEEDRLYFLKKMNWIDSQVDQYLRRSEVSHLEYGSEKPLWETAMKFRRLFNRSSG
jgi:N-acetyl sugar amidotransferase